MLNRTEVLNTKETEETKNSPDRRPGLRQDLQDEQDILSPESSDRGKSRRVLSKNSVSHDSLFPHNCGICKLFRTQ